VLAVEKQGIAGQGHCHLQRGLKLDIQIMAARSSADERLKVGLGGSFGGGYTHSPSMGAQNYVETLN
jgi:hypothetical protein